MIDNIIKFQTHLIDYVLLIKEKEKEGTIFSFSVTFYLTIITGKHSIQSKLDSPNMNPIKFPVGGKKKIM